MTIGLTGDSVACAMANAMEIARNRQSGKQTCMTEYIIFYRLGKEIKFSYVHAEDDLALAAKRRLANLVSCTEEQIISV